MNKALLKLNSITHAFKFTLLYASFQKNSLTILHENHKVYFETKQCHNQICLNHDIVSYNFLLL